MTSNKTAIRIIHIVFLFSIILISSKDITASCSRSAPTLTNTYGFYWGTAAIKDFGSVTIEDEIRAYVEIIDSRKICVGSIRVSKLGYYGSMAVYVDDPTTPEKDGVTPGDTIFFTICHKANEYRCDEISIWESSYVNDQLQLNLTGSSILNNENDSNDYTVKDALCALQTFLSICPTSCGDCDIKKYDVNNDRRCTPVDAYCILRRAMGYPSCMDK